MQLSRNPEQEDTPQDDGSAARVEGESEQGVSVPDGATAASPEQQDAPQDNDDTASVETETEESVDVVEETSSFAAWRADLLLAGLILLVFITDQVTKSWVRASLIEGASMPREGFLRITHVSNTGSAFGLFPNQTLFLLIASLVGIAVLLIFFRKQAGQGFMVRTSLGLQLGGATGNLVDRITMGKVTDFIDVGAWPVFNLADASIVTGIVILAWLLFRSPKTATEVEDGAEPEAMTEVEPEPVAEPEAVAEPEPSQAPNESETPP